MTNHRATERTVDQHGSTSGDDEVTEAMRESFPASDPPAWTLGSRRAADRPERSAEHLGHFRLPASTGQTLENGSFLGKIPVAVTFVPDLDRADVRTVITGFDGLLSEFGSLTAQVLIVARSTASETRTAADDLAVNLPILADPAGDFARRSGAEEEDGGRRLVTFVTDRDGRIHSRIEDVEPAELPSATLAQVREVVAASGSSVD